MKLGYSETVFDYFLGMTTNKSVYTWTGPYSNMTLKETFHMMFIYDFESVSFMGNQSHNETTWFLLPEGLCRSYKGNMS